MYKLSKIKATEDLEKDITRAVDLIGGFGSYIKKGDVVFLKPNFNTADPFPASSDLGFIRSLVNLIYTYGAKTVIIGESSTYSLNTRNVMEKVGVFDLEKGERPAKIHVLEERERVEKTIPEGVYLKKATLPASLENADKLILAPCLKTHKYAEFTGSLKLSMGFIKSAERIPFHISRLQEKIAELNRIISPDLVIMDARKCFINKGPSHGEIRDPKLIMASNDRIAIDVEGIKIIQSYEGNSLDQKDPWKIIQIKKAAEFGIGSKSEKDYDTYGNF